MENKLIKENLALLEKALKLPNPLVINKSLTVSLVLNRSTPLIAHLEYQPEDETVIVTAPLSYALPNNLEGLQIMMSKLLGDLLNRKKKVGRLVAENDEGRLILIQSIHLDAQNPQILADFVPKFIEEALSWKEKLEKTLETKKKPTCLDAEELLSFNFKFS